MNGNGFQLKDPRKVLSVCGFVASQSFASLVFKDFNAEVKEPIGDSLITKLIQGNGNWKDRLEFSLIDIDGDGDHFLIKIGFRLLNCHFKVRYSDYFAGLELPVYAHSLSFGYNSLNYYQKKNREYIGLVNQKLVTAYNDIYVLKAGMHKGFTENEILEHDSALCAFAELIPEFYNQSRRYKEREKSLNDEISSSSSDIDSSSEAEEVSTDEEDSTSTRRQFNNFSGKIQNNSGSTHERFVELPIEYPDDLFNVRNWFTFGVGRGSPFGRSRP